MLILFTKLNLAPGEVMTSILPEELHDEVPSGFNIAGHVGMSPLTPYGSMPTATDEPSTPQPAG
jgi:hypothetical protein